MMTIIIIIIIITIIIICTSYSPRSSTQERMGREACGSILALLQ
jgi:hypothetical protein